MIPDALEKFALGGPPQWALVRGQSRTSPVLLLVQQGPGFPIIHEAPVMERQLHLEDDFRVVYWDQRGTGKSYHPDNLESLRLETAVADVRRMVRALCERLRVPHVDIVGFSVGASLALLACTETGLPVRSLTCVGADVDLLESERFALQFAISEAERRGHHRALRALRGIGSPPHTEPKRFMTRARWVANFGGVHRRKTFLSLLRRTLGQLWSSPHYSLREIFGALRGMEATQERMLPSLSGFNLLDRPLHLPVPAAIFQGRHDAVAPPRFATVLADRLNARLVWFEDSAHMPHDEEPARFAEELRSFIGSLAPEMARTERHLVARK